MDIPDQAVEEQRVMRDLHLSLREAKEQRDEARIFYTTEAVNNLDSERYAD